MFSWTLLSFQVSQERSPLVSWTMLLSRPAPCTPTLIEELLESCFDKEGETGATPLQQQYRSLLEKSHIANMKRRPIPSTSSVNVEEEYHRTSTTLHKAQDRIIESLGALSEKESVLSRAGLWPRASPRDVLNKLTLSQRSHLSEPWKTVLVEYAESITMVQRTLRISRLTKRAYRAEMERELSNPGRVGWDGMSHPDWLLVELESNLLVRQVQAEIANEMLAPSSGKNAVVQLNMGEGKSSVRESLFRITTADLADRSSSPSSLRRLQIDHKSFVL